MLTLNNVITNLNNIADSHEQVNHFFYGEISDFASSGVVNYPAMMVTQEPTKLSRGVVTMSFNIYIADLVHKDDSDRREVASDTQSVIFDILAILDRTVSYEWNVDIDNITINDFVDKFQDEITGWWFTLNLRIPNALDLCAVPVNPPVVIKGGSDSGSGTPDVDPTAFVMVVDTTKAGSASDTFILPCGNTGTYNAVIDWGDSTTSTITTYDDADLTHVYSAPGEYTIQITGDLNWVHFVNSGDKLKLIDITQWGTVEILNWRSSYYGCANLVGTYTDTPSMDAVFTTRDTFRNCALFDGIVDNFNMAIVFSIQSMFEGCTVFNKPVNSWNLILNVSSSDVFRNCIAFNQPISNWNTSITTSMLRMLSGATVFNQDISLLDYSAMEDMTGILTNTSFSTANYDLLLISLAGQTLVSGVALGVGTTTYTTAVSGASRTDIVDNDLWVLTDGGGV